MPCGEKECSCYVGNTHALCAQQTTLLLLWEHTYYVSVVALPSALVGPAALATGCGVGIYTLRCASALAAHEAWDHSRWGLHLGSQAQAGSYLHVAAAVGRAHERRQRSIDAGRTHSCTHIFDGP